MKKTVALGLLGSVLDSGKRETRWERWRPSVALCQQEDLLIDRFVLLHQPRFERLATQVVQDIGTVSPETTVQARTVAFGDPWDFEDVYAALHDVARAYPFDPDREDYLVHITTGTHVAQICLFLLAEARYLPARLVQTAPPGRRGGGGPGTYRIIDLDLSRYDRIATRFEREHLEGRSLLKSGIETRNETFNRMVERLEHIAVHSTAPILLMGPTGAGKSHLARRLYELKRARRQVQGPLVEVNCATLRGDAAMSTLFGHKAGAFTGALADRPGLLRAADGGVLFLDEIGELGADEQAMLLRALEERTFLPLGSDREVSSDFQLMAGTNRDLRERVRAGRFREDLLARIDLWTFELPGLASRREDIEPNLDYELEHVGRSMGRLARFNKEARARFVRFALSPEATWRGNFRDLNAAVTRMATLAPAGRINVETVTEEVARLRSAWGLDGGGDLETHGRAAGSAELEDLLGPARLAELDLFDRVQLAEVVRVCRQSRSLSEAGRALFAVSRTRKRRPNDADRLRKYLARFRLSWQLVRG